MFIDLIIGLIVGIALSVFHNFGAGLIFASLIFSILPDIDFLIYHSFRPINRFSHKHRRIFHLPLLYILVGLIVLRVFNVSVLFSIAFIILSLWHFLHDTTSIGFGVQWLFPFSKKQYFWNKEIPTSTRVFGKLYSDTPKNIDIYADTHRDDNWAKKSFFR